MTSNIRGWFLIIGSVIAIIGFTLPVLYGVSYSPPAHAAAASIDIAALPDFGGAFSDASGGVYNGFSGPVDLHDTLIAIIVLFGLSLFALKFDIEHGIPWVKYLHHTASAVTQVFIVGMFIWKFRSRGAPPEIIKKFIADLGGSSSAIAAPTTCLACLEVARLSYCSDSLLELSDMPRGWVAYSSSLLVWSSLHSFFTRKLLPEHGDCELGMRVHSIYILGGSNG